MPTAFTKGSSAGSAVEDSSACSSPGCAPDERNPVELIDRRVQQRTQEHGRAEDLILVFDGVVRARDLEPSATRAVRSKPTDQLRAVSGRMSADRR